MKGVLLSKEREVPRAFIPLFFLNYHSKAQYLFLDDLFNFSLEGRKLLQRGSLIPFGFQEEIPLLLNGTDLLS